MKLLIVESPAKAKTINKLLGPEFKVISSFGHVRSLPSKKGAVDPDDNFVMHYEMLDKAKKNINEIVRFTKQSDELYLATDPDREGEAISWHIVEILKEKKVINKLKFIKRVVFYEITKKAILEAITNNRDIDINLVHAQQARQALDYLVGFTLSPVLWHKLPGSRSAGRVQSVALRIICDREYEIEEFVTKEYWSIIAECIKQKDQFLASLTKFANDKIGKMTIKNAEQSEQITQELKKHQYYIFNVIKKQTSRKPYAPFTTSTLLQDAANKIGFSAKKTSIVAQKLYEGITIDGNTVGLITYMRTDSTNISKEFQELAKQFIAENYGSQYTPKQYRVFKTKTKNAQEAHEAIRPTHIQYAPDIIKQHLSDEQYKLYLLIWKRFISSQMSDAKIDLVVAHINSHNDEHSFKANGSSIAFNGFLVIYNQDSEESNDNILPDLEKDQTIDIKDLLSKQHFTQPPARYTEASLVKKMEELGIGRPSTYPAIISVLQERKYVILEKKRFIAEIRGRIVNAFLVIFFHKYVEYDFTAHLEDELDNISNAKLEYKKVLQDFWQPFKQKTDEIITFNSQDILIKIQKSLQKFISNFIKDDNCSECKKGKLELKFSKFGAFLGCSNYPDCRYTKLLDAQQDQDTEMQSMQYPKILGKHPELQYDISLRKGPYGIYVQLDANEKKEIKRSSIPKDISCDQITLPDAIRLLALPKILGKHPKTQKEIKVGIGKYGPFIKYNNKFIALKKHDPITISLKDAIMILETNKEK